METVDYARGIVLGETLAAKLAPPPAGLTDLAPGPPATFDAPGRPPELAIVSGRCARTPPLEGMADPAQRIRILHAFANHELQAVELFARALARFTGAEASFRRGLVAILAEEQTHLRLYLDRLGELRARFGDHPVSGYFWGKAPAMDTPLAFVCAMGLTFESANLDHALAYEAEARRLGDLRTAAVLRRVHDDEVGHVRFGWRWLAKLKAPGQSMAAAYRASLAFPLRPALGRGPVFHPESRRAAGLDEDFIAMLGGEEEG